MQDKRHFAVEELCFEPVAERRYEDSAVAFAIPLRLPPQHARVSDVFMLNVDEVLERATLVRATGVVAERTQGSAAAAS